MLTMTQQTGTQLKPLLNVQIDKADFSQIDKTLGITTKSKNMVPVPAKPRRHNCARWRGGRSGEGSSSFRENDRVHSTGLRSMKRNALESFVRWHFYAVCSRNGRI